MLEDIPEFNHDMIKSLIELNNESEWLFFYKVMKIVLNK